MRHLKAIFNWCLKRATLPMAQASEVKARLQLILDRARDHNDVSKKMKVVVLLVMTLVVYPFCLIGFPLPSPPNRAVRLDAQSYLIIGRTNAATSTLRSLWARFHAVTTFTNKRDSDITDGTLFFQRPSFVRVEVPGVDGWSVASDGSNERMVAHDGSYNGKPLPVDWNGDNISSDDYTYPFVQYFFRPDFDRLGSMQTQMPELGIFPSGLHEIPISVRGWYCGTQRWHGDQYQVVKFTRDYFPRRYGFINVTMVYVGADHLVHRIIGKDYFYSGGIRTDDVSLSDIQTDRLLPRTSFRLPVDEHPGT